MPIPHNNQGQHSPSKARLRMLAAEGGIQPKLHRITEKIGERITLSTGMGGVGHDKLIPGLLEGDG